MVQSREELGHSTIMPKTHFLKKSVEMINVNIFTTLTVFLFIRNAKKSVDVCLYLFTCPEYGNVLLSCLKETNNKLKLLNLFLILNFVNKF